MNELQIFNNPEFGEIRAVDIDGVPWLVGKDVAERLGYSNPRDAIIKHVDDEDRDTVALRDGTSGNPNLTVINESGLYSLVLSSKLPNAKKFRHWVTKEVLPSIRKHGVYAIDDVLANPDMLIAALTELKAERSKRKDLELTVQAQTAKIGEMQGKADYFDALVDRETLTNFRETAKEFKVGQKELVSFLIDEGYVYRDKKGHLLPTAEKGEGLFEVKECIAQRSEWSGVQTLITPKGRETFRLLMPLHEEKKAKKSKKHKAK